jgi:hypothetical protein
LRRCCGATGFWNCRRQAKVPRNTLLIEKCVVRGLTLTLSHSGSHTTRLMQIMLAEKFVSVYDFNLTTTGTLQDCMQRWPQSRECHVLVVYFCEQDSNVCICRRPCSKTYKVPRRREYSKSLDRLVLGKLTILQLSSLLVC